MPDDSKIAKVQDWLPCKNITDIWAFLGLAGFMHIWIKNYLATACPLVNLMRKGETFVCDDQQEAAMQQLKDAIINSQALISINYSTNHPIYLAVNSSWHRVGWILSQECADGKQHPARFGSISWNKRESQYSQPKVELYGLFHALRTLQLHLVGVHNLVVKMDAVFICRMLNNPNIQPNTTINRWITVILLFDFKLVHIPAKKHHGPDGLSRHEPVEGEDAKEGNPEDWINATLGLGIWASSVMAVPRPPFSTQINSVLSMSAEDVLDQPINFPSSDKSLNAETEMLQIQHYLKTNKKPHRLFSDSWDKFLRKMKRFILNSEQLWRCNNHSQHQLFIPPSQ